MKKIDILGCCVLRDAFRVANSPDYHVGKFYQFVNPVSIVSTPAKFELTSEALSRYEWTNFVKKCVCSDFNKNIPQVYAKEPADFLVIDFCEMRFPNTQITLSNGENLCITKHRYTDAILKDSDEFDFLRGAKTEQLKFSDSDRLAYIGKYMDLLTSIYPQSKIILVKNKPYHKYIDEERREIASFDVTANLTIRKRLDAIHEFVEKKYPDINVIDIPDNAVCYAQHIWGIDPLHFYDQYYQYLFKAIDITCSEGDNKKARIEELRKVYSMFFSELEEHKHSLFIAEKATNGNNILRDCCFREQGAWSLSLSAASSYDREECILSCSSNESPWAILSQPIDLKSLNEKNVVLSVKAQTFNNTSLNICIRYTGSDGKFKFPIFQKCVSESKLSVSSVSQLISIENEQITDAKVMIYLTEQNARAKITEAKLEFGNTTTLL